MGFLVLLSVPDEIHYCGSGSPAVHNGSQLLATNFLIY